MSKYSKYMLYRSVENTLSEEEKAKRIKSFNGSLESVKSPKMHHFPTFLPKDFNYQKAIDEDQERRENHVMEEDVKEYFLYCILNDIDFGEMYQNIEKEKE